jgi:hypothetical protein
VIIAALPHELSSRGLPWRVTFDVGGDFASVRSGDGDATGCKNSHWIAILSL